MFVVPVRIVEEVVQAIGSSRTGIRLSPHGLFNDMSDYPELTDQYAKLAAGLGKLKLSYLHLNDQAAMGFSKPLTDTIEAVRENFRASGGGAIILCGGYDKARAEADLQSGVADLIAFGRPYIANPDLAERLHSDAELTTPEEESFYLPGEEGYTDYPALKNLED